LDAAYAVIVAHNHPSGESSPSILDLASARRLYWAADLLQIELLDFIIVGASDYFSVAQAPRWPPSQFISEQRDDPSDSYYSPDLDCRRLVRVRATQSQWNAMKGEYDIKRLLTMFLITATRSQLLRLRKVTPLFFDSSEPPGYFVGVRNFRATDTHDWWRAKLKRALVANTLRRHRIALT
jgi:hypothetical protein